MRPLVKSSVSQLYEVEFEGNSSGINLLVSLATLTGGSQLRLPFGISRFSDEQEQGQNPLQCDRFLLRSNSLHLLGGRKDKGLEGQKSRLRMTELYLQLRTLFPTS